MNDTHKVEISIDGLMRSYDIADITTAEDGTVTMRCTPREEDAKVVQTEEKSAYSGERPRIRSYGNCSCLVRLMMNGRMVTVAITHCTDRAVRVLNLELGAAWLPKNVLRWSEVAGMLCVTEMDYWPDFTKSISKSMTEYPVLFNADELYTREFTGNCDL